MIPKSVASATVAYMDTIASRPSVEIGGPLFEFVAMGGAVLKFRRCVVVVRWDAMSPAATSRSRAEKIVISPAVSATVPAVSLISALHEQVGLLIFSAASPRRFAASWRFEAAGLLPVVANGKASEPGRVLFGLIDHTGASTIDVANARR